MPQGYGGEVSAQQPQKRLSVTREDYGISLDIEVIDDQAECVAIYRLAPYPPLTGAQLRRLPLAKLVREAIPNTWRGRTRRKPHTIANVATTSSALL